MRMLLPFVALASITSMAGADEVITVDRLPCKVSGIPRQPARQSIGSPILDGASKEQRYINCAGKGIEITGNDNGLRLDNCIAVSIKGDNNYVDVLAANLKLTITGSYNRVAYSLAPGSNITNLIVGKNNTVKKFPLDLAHDCPLHHQR